MNDLAHRERRGLTPVAEIAASGGSVDSIEYNPYYQRVIEKVLHLASTVFLNSQRSEESVSIVDKLTGLPNGNSAEIFFESEWNQARCQKYRFAVLVVVIENLPQLASHYGRAAVDRLMVETAEKLQINLQKYEFLSRTGQDEFVAVLPAEAVADLDDTILQIQDSVEDIIYRRFNKVAGDVNIRIGAAEYGIDGFALAKLYTVARDTVRVSINDELAGMGSVVRICDYRNDAPCAS